MIRDQVLPTETDLEEVPVGVMTGDAAAGDSWLIQPTRSAAAGMDVAITDPAKIVQDARYWRRRIKAHKKAIRKLTGLLEKARKRAANRKASGRGPYAGTQSVAMEIARIVEKHRGPGKVGSQKRWETYGNPGSDHYAGTTNAYAIDFLLGTDYEMARIIYAELTGNSPSSWPGDYQHFYIVRGGKSFRIQLIAANHGTGPHLHAGCRAA